MIGSSDLLPDITFCVKSDDVSDIHCKLVFDSSQFSCTLTNLSETSSTWVKDSDAWTLIEKGDTVMLRPNGQFRLGLGVKFELLRFSSGLAFAQGVRPSMEDEEVLIDDLYELGLSWYACYDGHGGNDCSSFIKENLHVNFANKFKDTKCITTSLLSAFEKTETDFFTLSSRTGLSPNVGAVVNVVVVSDTNIVCANLGDCRAIFCEESTGNVVQLSADHKPASELTRILSRGGTVSNGRVNGRLAVSRAIGDFEFKPDEIVSAVPEIRSRQLTPGFLVIACDGLFDVINSSEVASFTKRRIEAYMKREEDPDPKQIAIDLVTEAVMKRNSRDNVSVIVVFLK